MLERGISEADVTRAYATKKNPPGPGDNGALVWTGLATNRQSLSLVCSEETDESVFVVTLYWTDR